ncbi:alpha/beta hydrolase [Planctomycetaceae bacterium]|nr:alpha/beta hydrolase [Planctomycetaceae bacterium]
MASSLANAQNKKQKPAANPHANILRDIEYSKPDGKPQLLDLYLPKKGDGPFPVVTWVHGGGWKNGSRKNCPASWLVEHGFAVASIDYRLIPAQWPAQIDDCRAAVRWLRFNADNHNLDPNHIAVWGGSAGGHLVAMMGTLPPPDFETTSSRVQAVCDWFGPTDLLTMPPNVISKKRTAEQVAQSNGAKLLGAPVWTIPEKAMQASAFHQVSKGDPPFLIMHGEKDPGVPLIQSEMLHDALQMNGVESTLHIVKGAGHGGKEFRSPEVQKMILEFFEKHLRRKMFKEQQPLPTQ